jgi:hypothetical protein
MLGSVASNFGNDVLTMLFLLKSDGKKIGASRVVGI